MPCVNRCWHCFCEGSPQGRFMDTEKCIRIDQLAGLKAELDTTVFPMFYDEPTLHPSFKQIMKHQLANRLIFDQWWFSTNGYGLARMSDADWKELAEAGFDFIRLTFHGTGKTHDKLVGRDGAYEDMVRTINKAEKHNLNWLAGMMLNSQNQAMYEDTEKAIEKLGKQYGEFGWMLPHSEGRAANGGNRVKFAQVSRLLQGKHGWYTEGDYVKKVLADPDLSRKTARDNKCGIVYLDIDEDLNVYFGGGCDGDPFGFVKEKVFLGNLEETTISSCYHKYLNEPPEPVRLLNQVTWGELAVEFGDKENDEVFHYTSLTGHKWLKEYLKAHYEKKGT
jgi:MoaA/NifB/PqqE/SkfB family radical SAM enzyme